MDEQQHLQQAIAHLEAQRLVLGDAALRPLQQQLATFDSAPTHGSPYQRKQMTILFADVSGFTALSETLDAEEVAEAMHALWAELDNIITAHGGMIDKHMGDAVMALWGAESVREDDAEQAIRTAWAMQAAMLPFATSRQLPISLRIGINTGAVLLGEMGTRGEITAMGDPVNLASRLEHAAPVGGILISHDTYRHVRGVFNVQVRDLLTVKGKRQPVQTYLVTGIKPRAFRLGNRGIEGIDTRLINRKDEFAKLQKALATVIDTNNCQVVTIVAEAGIGKSRLLYEFDAWVEVLPDDVFYFKGRASHYQQSLPYGLLRDLFMFRFNVQDTDQPATVQDKFEQGMQEWTGTQTDARLQAHLLGYLLGFGFHHSPYLATISDAEQLRDQVLVVLRDYFTALAAQSPVLILLEDIHWADDSSLAILQTLLNLLANHPVLLICTARPLLLERCPQWMGKLLSHTQLPLTPLSHADSHQLVAEIFQKVDTPSAAIQEVIISSAEGNPYYIEEMVKILIEEGAIIPGEETWVLEPARLQINRVPPTLTGILQARLDHLSTEEHACLERAAVFGRVFWDTAVASLGKQESSRTTAEILDNTIFQHLQERELIFKRTHSTFADAHEYVFKSAVLRDVVYERTLKRTRQQYHQWAAGWFIAMTAPTDRTTEYAALIADHYDQAGVSEQASVWYRRAGTQAMARYAHHEAITLMSRALDLVPDTDHVQRYEILLLREEIYEWQRDQAAWRQDLRCLLLVTNNLQDDARRIDVLLRHAHYANATSDYATAIQLSDHAIALAQKLQLALREARGEYLQGYAHESQGNLTPAHTHYTRALQLLEDTPASSLMANVLRQLARVVLQQESHIGAQSHLERALTTSQQIGDRKQEAQILNELGIIADARGDQDISRRYYEQSLVLARELGYRVLEGNTLANLGACLLEQGKYVEMEQYLLPALHIFRAIGDRRNEAIVLENLGDSASFQGAHADAKADYEQALSICDAIGDRQGVSILESNLGLLAHQRGQDREAYQHAERAYYIAREMGDRQVQGKALLLLGHSLTGLDRLDAATSMYRQSAAIYQETEQPHLLQEPLAGLIRVALAKGEVAQALVYTEHVVEYVHSNQLPGTLEPMRLYLTCYRAFCAVNDPRAPELLASAYAILHERVTQIADEERRRWFLERIPAHRALSEAYHTLHDTHNRSTS